MTKVLINTYGQMKVLLIMNFENYTNEVTGYYSGADFKSNFENCLKNAILNAKYRFFKNRSIKNVYEDNIIFSVIDFDINYKNVVLKRKNINGHYFLVGRDYDNKQVLKTKWTYKNEYDNPDIRLNESD